MIRILLSTHLLLNYSCTTKPREYDGNTRSGTRQSTRRSTHFDKVHEQNAFVFCHPLPFNRWCPRPSRAQTRHRHSGSLNLLRPSCFFENEETRRVSSNGGAALVSATAWRPLTYADVCSCGWCSDESLLQTVSTHVLTVLAHQHLPDFLQSDHSKVIVGSALVTALVSSMTWVT
jgi:hypothetical protein